MRPEIAPALPGDAATLALLLRHDPVAGDCPLWPGITDDPLPHIRHRIALGGVRIVHVKGRPAGFIDCAGAEILSLYIAPHARRHGLARGLVAEAKEAAPRLTAICPREDDAARAFWAAQGFAPATAAAGQPDAASLSRLIWNGAA